MTKDYSKEKGFKHYSIRTNIGSYALETFENLDNAKEALKEWKKVRPESKIVAKLEVEIEVE